MPSQYWLLWYLRCLILWRLLAIWLLRLPLVAQALIAAATGLSGAYASVFAAAYGLSGPEALVDLIRAASLLPYFVIGMHLDFGSLSGPSARSSCRGLLAGWIALLLFVFSYVAFEASIDRAVFRAAWWSDAMWFSGVCGRCGSAADLVWAHYAADLALNAALGLLFFACCVPRRSSWLSRRGAHTLYPYLLHDRALWLLLRVWSGLLGGSRPARGLLAGCLQATGWGVLSICLALLLSSWPCRAVFRWAVEPRWLPMAGCGRRSARRC